MPKKAREQAVKGETGIHLIQAAVDAMGHLWHPTVGIDSGIDGQIELRDPATGEVRNVRIGVQSRANPSRWVRETDRGFSYRPPPEDVSYWLSSNQPVLLVCSRPKTREVYWRSVQEWVRDPAQRARGHIRFDKERDRFDVSAATKLFDLKATATDRVEPPGPAPQEELLTTNLMPVRWHRDELFSVATPPFSDASELFRPAWQNGLRHAAGVLHRGAYWSLLPFERKFVEAIGGTDLSVQQLSAILAGAPHALTDVLKELVVRTVVADHEELTWHAYKRVAYFRRRVPEQNVRHKWREGAPKTVVFANVSDDEDRHFTGYRHDAAELVVRELGDIWAVEVAPTYLFTWDGRQLSSFHQMALAGIKRIERHKAVSSALRMWEHLLVERQTFDKPAGDAPFGLDALLTVRVPVGLDENAWKRLSEQDALEAQGTIFDVMDELA